MIDDGQLTTVFVQLCGSEYNGYIGAESWPVIRTVTRPGDGGNTWILQNTVTSQKIMLFQGTVSFSNAILDSLSLIPIPLGTGACGYGFALALIESVLGVSALEADVIIHADWVNQIHLKMADLGFNMITDILFGHSLGAACVTILVTTYAFYFNSSVPLLTRAVLIGTPNSLSAENSRIVNERCPNFGTYINRVVCTGIRFNFFDALNPFKGFGFSRSSEIYDWIWGLPPLFTQPTLNNKIITIPPDMMNEQCRNLSRFKVGTDQVVTGLSRFLHHSAVYQASLNQGPSKRTINMRVPLPIGPQQEQNQANFETSLAYASSIGSVTGNRNDLILSKYETPAELSRKLRVNTRRTYP